MAEAARAAGSASRTKTVYTYLAAAIAVVGVLAVLLSGNQAQQAAKAATAVMPGQSTVPPAVAGQARSGPAGGAFLETLYAPGPLNSSGAATALAARTGSLPINVSYDMSVAATPSDPAYPASIAMRYWRMGGNSRYAAWYENYNATNTVFYDVYDRNGSISECNGNINDTGMHFSCDNSTANMSDEIFLDPQAFRYFDVHIRSVRNATWDDMPATFVNGTAEQLDSGVNREFRAYISDRYLVPLSVTVRINTGAVSLSENSTLDYVNSNVSYYAVVREANLTNATSLLPADS